MIATIMQARRISFLKAHLNTIFKESKNHPSISLKIKSLRHLNKGNCKNNLCIYMYIINFMT